jgi:urease accessory protein
VSGLLDLTLARRGDGRTGVVKRRQRFPLRMTVPMYLDDELPDLPFIYVQNPTGGLFPDDDLVVSLDVAEHARVHVTTQSATKAYAGEGPGARQRTQVHLADGAYAELIPDTLIPHAGARVDQELAVNVGEGSTFVSSELLAPGRHPRTERFAYDRIRLATVIRDSAGSELCVDVLEIEPARRSPAVRGVLGEYTYVGTFIAFAPRVDVERLASLVDEALCDDPRVAAGAGVLPGQVGVGARVLAHRAADARVALDAAWAIARRELLDAPLPRRRK